MALVNMFANVKLEATDANGDTLKITKRVNYQIDDATFGTAALQVGAVATAIDNKIAAYCANTTGTARTVMGLVGVEIGFLPSAATFTNISDWASGTIPAGQTANSVKRSHVQMYAVNGKGLFKFSAPEPTDALENQDEINVEANVVFPIGDALAAGVYLCNSYFDQIGSFKKSKFRAK